MVIDINATLRRLVLAGLPLTAACNTGGPAAPGAGMPAALAACFSGTVFQSQYSGPMLNARVSFHRNDPRFSDLYAACTEEQLHCVRLCSDLLMTASPGGHRGAGPSSCDLGCEGDKLVASINYSTATPGRRPEGFCDLLPTGPGTALGNYWAAVAAAEGASITAFRTLARELAAHGAPAELVTRARTSARQEARHFRLTRALARRHGQEAGLPQNPRPATRSLLQMAHENVVEGCVNETFAAALALHAAQHAADAEVRTMMSEIADDEIAHAQLAYDVNAWALSRLSPAQTEFLAAERRRAAAALLAASCRAVEPALVRQAGLPAAPQAAFLAVETAAALWAA